MKTIFVLLACLPFASHASQISEACPPKLSVGLQINERYTRLHRSSLEEKRVRFLSRRSLLEEIVANVTGRPMDSGNSTRGELRVTLVAGGLQSLRLEDIAQPKTLAKIVKLIRAADLPTQMWVAQTGEVMPTEHYYGLTKLIIEHEHLLSGFADAIDQHNAMVASYILDSMILKHQNYLDLKPEMRAAIDENFTPAGFDFGGIQLPIHYPASSAVGSEIIFAARDLSETATILQSREATRTFAEDLLQTIALREATNPDLALVPASTQIYARWKIEDLRKMAEEQRGTYRALLPAPGLYRGHIVKVFPAGFDFRAAGGQVYRVNVNFGVKLMAILLRPPIQNYDGLLSVLSRGGLIAPE